MSDSEWLDWRRQGITATDVADAANGTYGGAYGVVARKLGLITVAQNAAMERGHRWQPKVADAVHALTGLWVVGEETWCQHTDNPMIRATVDGFLAEVDTDSFDDCIGVVEIKTRGRGVRPNRERWADQVQWQLLATGLELGLIAEAAIDDIDDICDSVHLREVKADPFRQDHLLTVAKQLWAYVEAGTLPAPDHPSALPDVKQVHSAPPEGDRVDLSDLADLVRRLHDIKAAVKAVTDERDLLEAKIRSAVGNAPGGTCDGFVVNVSKPRREMTPDGAAQLLELRPDLAVTTLDKKRAKAEASDLYDAHSAATGARTLTIKELP